MRTTFALALADIAGSVAAAVPEWQPIGENANGNKIFVDKASVRKQAGSDRIPEGARRQLGRPHPQARRQDPGFLDEPAKGPARHRFL